MRARLTTRGCVKQLDCSVGAAGLQQYHCYDAAAAFGNTRVRPYSLAGYIMHVLAPLHLCAALICTLLSGLIRYVVLRYAEIVGAPDPPTSDSVYGWAVQYPFDGQTAEHDNLPVLAECTARRFRHRTLSAVRRRAVSSEDGQT